MSEKKAKNILNEPADISHFILGFITEGIAHYSRLLAFLIFLVYLIYQAAEEEDRARTTSDLVVYICGMLLSALLL
jgi:hypothetical protein